MALSLVKCGVKVRIIEQASVSHDAIRGTAIMPRTLELLSILGVKEDFDARALPPLQMAIYDPSGMTVLEAFDWSAPAQDTSTIPYATTISQAALEGILRRRLHALGCDVERGKELAGISQTSEAVTASVTLSDGATEDIEYGAKGRSRRLLDIQFIGDTLEADRMISANVQVPGFSREYWHRWGDFAKAAISLKPVDPAPLFQLQALGPLMQKELPSDVTSLQTFFNSIAIREDIVFKDAAWISEWKANIRMAEKFSNGRVFLAGDVAHCHSPAGGQGANTAMQDAFNLAWKMALVVKKAASISLLSTYEAERMPVVAEMLNLSNALHARAFAHIPNAAFEAAPESSAPADPMQRSVKLLQLGVNYRWSQIVLDARDTGEQSLEKNPYGILGANIRAGDRAPFFGGLRQGENTTNLFNLLDENAGAHLILVFPTSGVESVAGHLNRLKPHQESGLAKVVVISHERSQTQTEVEVLEDVDRVAYTAYNVDEQTTLWVAIRPDGIIGAYVYTADGLVDYFSRLDVTL
ncbi:FAD/NAD(P)-binding domain-containing protein [Hymenopellis radicata]|nr:FAD/NAD(P)-binding domain-containing protein [Hymenopellis radicata]